MYSKLMLFIGLEPILFTKIDFKSTASTIPPKELTIFILKIVGFEPTVFYNTLIFKISTLGHSVIFPINNYIKEWK